MLALEDFTLICLGTLTRYATAALVTAASLSCLTTSAFADSYDLYVAGPQGGDIYAQGINSSGQALIYDGRGYDAPTYYVTDHGNIVSTSHTVPATFVPDNGSACTISYQGVDYAGVCNNGYEAFGQHYIDTSLPFGLIIGQDGVFTEPYTAGFAYIDPRSLFLNSSGDVAFLDGFNDSNFQAYNTTTPEPSSYLLLLTGAGLAFAFHRRLLS